MNWTRRGRLAAALCFMIWAGCILWMVAWATNRTAGILHDSYTNYALNGSPDRQARSDQETNHIQNGAKNIPLRRRKVRNPHPFSFTMGRKSEACAKGANAEGVVDVLCLVNTAPGDGYMRSLIRKTWGSAKLVKGKRIVTMFLLGRRNPETQYLLQLENNLYHDIIQENFIDSYYNVTLKTLMGLKWAGQFCSNARFVLKVNIDMFVNVYNLADHIETVPGARLAEGDRKGITKPIRNKQSKWYTSRSVYPNDTYPPYLTGSSYLLSGDLPVEIFEQSFFYEFLPWEDAFVGIVLNQIGLDPTHSDKYLTQINYRNQHEALAKIRQSVTFPLGDDKDENKENIVMVWNYVRKLNEISMQERSTEG